MNVNRSIVVSRPLLACCEQLCHMLVTQLNFLLVPGNFVVKKWCRPYVYANAAFE